MNHALAVLLPVFAFEDLAGAEDIQAVPDTQTIDLKITPAPNDFVVTENAAEEPRIPLAQDLLMCAFHHQEEALFPTTSPLRIHPVFQNRIRFKPRCQKLVRVDTAPTGTVALQVLERAVVVL